MLASDEVLLRTMLPVSTGLLHDVERYVGALDAYHGGAIEPIIECLADALELAAVVGSRIASDVDEVLAGWAIEACEVTIPVETGNSQGKWYEEEG